MNIRNEIILLVIFISLITGCKKNDPTNTDGKAKTIHDLLVKEGEIAGWTYSGSNCAASSIDELYGCIDGAAPIYQRHGFIESEQQSYQGTVNSTAIDIKIEIYNQGTAENALALYNDSDLGFEGATDWSEAGHAGDIAHFVRYGLSQKLAFCRSCYYVYIECPEMDTNESLTVIQQFALNIDEKIPH